ncbi:MAG: class I SAM-dependent methyltransferase [Nocardioides sp.]|nr:class I SAM-dependent methyltransferase [Nocardioides sp.]
MPRPTSPAGRPWRASLRRSLRLFRDFRHEQDDPARFYTALATDSAAHVGQYADLADATLLDVGGGPGYFRDAFTAAGATYFSLDADVGELSGLGEIVPGTVIGSGLALPFRDNAVDVCYSSNVLEHVPDPWLMADEMVRVTRPGGVTFISYTVWFGPWGGHETAPWHYLGGARARRRYARVHGKEPKNKYGESLFPVTVAAGLAWADRQQGAEVVDLAPRYNPRWSRFLMFVPVVREVVTWNLVIVLRKR